MKISEGKAKTVNMRQAMALTGAARRTIYYWIRLGIVQVEPHTKPWRIIAASLPPPRRKGSKRVQTMHT